MLMLHRRSSVHNLSLCTILSIRNCLTRQVPVKSESPHSSYSEGTMPYSATSLAILRSMRDGHRYLLRGDKCHGCQVRYSPATKQREDRSALSLIPLERAGLIEFESEPLNPKRYYSVKLTKKGRDYLDENDALAQERAG